MCCFLCFRYQGYIGAALVLGGVDCNGPHLYSIYPHGSTDKLPYVTMGQCQTQHPVLNYFPFNIPYLSENKIFTRVLNLDILNSDLYAHNGNSVAAHQLTKQNIMFWLGKHLIRAGLISVKYNFNKFNKSKKKIHLWFFTTWFEVCMYAQRVLNMSILEYLTQKSVMHIQIR